MTCAVYGMQDGREKFRKLNNALGDKKPAVHGADAEVEDEIIAT